MALSANAQPAARAALTARQVTNSRANGPLLICKYVSPNAKFEILSQNGKCAPYINVQ
jgi:hypothetical protein